jgi:aromatic-L-amino-acid/L-tryptophan decarboxylase
MADTLGMSAEEMRALGHRIVDLVVDHIETIGDTPALATGTPHDLRAALSDGSVPRRPGELHHVMTTMTDVILANMQHGDHPRYFARVPGPSSFAGIAADWLSTGFNGIASSWGGGSGPSAAELVVVSWLAELMGMPSDADGVVLSGGSSANLTALAAARQIKGDGVVYLGDQTHSCVAKALHMLGYPPSQQRTVDTGRELRLTVARVRAAIEADLAAGLTPTVVVATAGTTNTGDIDDIDGLADLAEEFGLWLHVDGAYGAPVRLCASWPAALDSLGRADSLVIDPHKWMFQPYDIACLLVREAGTLSRCFASTPEYLADVFATAHGEVDLRNRGPELTRRSRAVKLWFTMSLYGVDHLGAAIEHGVRAAESAQRMLSSDERWEIVTPARLGIVTFARSGAGDAAHQRAAAAVTASGHAAVTCTRLFGRQVLRLCTINPRTTDDDLSSTIERLAVACDHAAAEVS